MEKLTKTEFDARYRGNSKQKIKKAIRAECSGGNDVLDGLNTWHKIRQRKEAGEAESLEEINLARQTEDLLHAIRNAMEDEIRARYALPAREAL